MPFSQKAEKEKAPFTNSENYTIMLPVRVSCVNKRTLYFDLLQTERMDVP